MIKTRKLTAVIILLLTISACGNKSSQTKYEPNNDLTEDVFVQPDTIVTEEEQEMQEEVKKPSTPTGSSSSRSQKSSSYDNMRGFDPASENDMDDNGMSRYMENDDDEGWD